MSSPLSIETLAQACRIGAVVAAAVVVVAVVVACLAQL